MTRNIKYKAVSRHMEEMVKPSSSHGRVSVGFEKNIGEYFYIHVDKLLPYHKQARRVFDDASIAALADTIKQHGIRQPLSVLPLEGSNTGEYEIISGERRYRAAKIAGLEKVPCIIIGDRKLASEIALIENIQREDLHPIELGEAILELLKTGNYYSKTELSKKLGISKTTVVESIRMAELSCEAKSLVLVNKIINREFLRILIQEKNVILQKQMIENYIGKNLQQNTTRVHRKKIIALITLESGSLKVNLRGIHLLTADQKQIIKQQFESLFWT